MITWELISQKLISCVHPLLTPAYTQIFPTWQCVCVCVCVCMCVAVSVCVCLERHTNTCHKDLVGNVWSTLALYSGSLAKYNLGDEAWVCG